MFSQASSHKTLTTILWSWCAYLNRWRHGSSKPAVPQLFGPRDHFRGRQLEEGDGSGGNVGDDSSNYASDGEPAADEASLSRPPLTSCRAAQFLTGHGPVAVRGLGIGDPFSKQLNNFPKVTQRNNCMNGWNYKVNKFKWLFIRNVQIVAWPLSLWPNRQPHSLAVFS